MPLGISRINSLARPLANLPVFGQGSAKPIFGFETNTSATNTSSWDITVPTATKDGDLLLLLGAATDDRFVTPPTGWTEIADVKNGGQSAAHVFWRRANGDDQGGSSYSYVPASSGRYTNTCLTIRNADDPAISSGLITTSNTATTNSVSGTGNSLYISFIGARNLSTASLISAPSTMDLINFQYSSGAFNAIAGIYSTATSFNPGDWSFDAENASNCVGWTIRV